jgi:hypothetical protein
VCAGIGFLPHPFYFTLYSNHVISFISPSLLSSINSFGYLCKFWKISAEDIERYETAACWTGVTGMRESLVLVKRGKCIITSELPVTF